MIENGTKCAICKRELDNPDDPLSRNCGGDCLQCMADAGDPDCKKAVDQHNEARK